MQNYQGLGKLITLTSTLIIPHITKISSNNCLILKSEPIKHNENNLLFPKILKRRLFFVVGRSSGEMSACTFTRLPEIQLKNEILVQPTQFQFQQDYFHTSYLANNKLSPQARRPARHIVEGRPLGPQPSIQV